MYKIESEFVDAALSTYTTPADDDGGRTGKREWSWDYCFNYFGATDDPTAEMELSCLQLGYYLASWGMLRGSSWLFKNAHSRHYVQTIEAIARHTPLVAHIDLGDYSDAESRNRMVAAYNDIRTALIPARHQHATVVTKVMLGVWGNTPAFDTYLKKGLRRIVPSADQRSLNSFTDRSLQTLGRIYTENQELIDRIAATRETVAFSPEGPASRPYTRARVLDIAGFALGQ